MGLIIPGKCHQLQGAMKKVNKVFTIYELRNQSNRLVPGTLSVGLGFVRDIKESLPTF